MEMYEEIFPSSLNLRSKIFIKLQNNRGGYWDNKKFIDYFQINWLHIIYFKILILFEISDNIAIIERIIHEDM